MTAARWALSWPAVFFSSLKAELFQVESFFLSELFYWLHRLMGMPLLPPHCEYVCNESLIVGLMVMGQILLIPSISLCLRYTCWIFAWGLFFRTDLPLVEFLYSVYLIFFCSVSWGVTSVFNYSTPMFSANTGSNVPFVQWYRKLRFGGHFRWWGLMGM